MREKDLETWQTWKKQPTPNNMQAVLDQLNPLIQKEVNHWTGTLARPALEIEAKHLAIEAIESFSPTGGAALSTHVMNRLKKLSRILYTHQNIARMPEYQTLKWHTYNQAKTTLQDKLGREPTVDELSEDLRWPRNNLASFQKSIRKELVESGEPPPMFDDTTDEHGMVDFVFHDFSPVQKQLFQHTTGYGGVPVITNPQIMKKMNMTQGQLSYQKRILIDKLQTVMSPGEKQKA